MRTIEFRGKSKDGNKWVFGTIAYSESREKSQVVAFINHDEDTDYCYDEVEPNTVGQFTSFLDKHNNKIFEGDILSDYTQIDEGVIKSHRQVFWCEKTGAWMLDESYIQDKSASRLLSKELEEFDYEISGNIHETPELLQATEMKRTRE